MVAPAVLYHYTDSAGLFGLVTSGNLRLGDARFLNDSTEFVHGINIAREVVTEALKETDGEKILERTRHYLSPEFVFRQLYVFSLSETAESISQWQRYGADGYGYCIGFNRKRLQEMYSDRATLRQI